MIKIFTGEDRVFAKRKVEDFLGKDYEIIEGAELDIDSLPSIFQGQSLFMDRRKILVRDISLNKAVFDKLPDYLDTPHDIAILELKLDKRSSGYKALRGKIEIEEFALKKDPNLSRVFDIYGVAKKDGKKAVAILESIKNSEDPILFFSLMSSQAIKDFERRQGTKEKKVLKELSHLDLELKSSKLSAWLLIESFLLRLSSL